MKKVFFVLIASAALSFTACSSGGNKTETVNQAEMDSMANEAKEAATPTVQPADTMMTTPADTMKHM
jgi:ABC-type Fe3+-hydroxamate transport system substrate-binding protein